MTMTAPATALAYQTLISPVDWERIVARIERDHDGINHEHAECILNEALGYVKFLAENPGEISVPSEEVDIGWHTLILYTRVYEALCQQLAGRFIHHEPRDMPGRTYAKGGTEATASRMEQQGFLIDRQLWLTGASSGCDTSCCGGGQD